jgi:polysaccharide deacetylase 2 family uncharacterized protein YibQ
MNDHGKKQMKSWTLPGVFFLCLGLCLSLVKWNPLEERVYKARSFFYEQLELWPGQKPQTQKSQEHEVESLSGKMDQALGAVQEPLDIKPTKPFKKNSSHPSITIILTHVGGDQDLWKKILSQVPTPVILAFQGHHPSMGRKMQEAQKAGFNCAKMIPMEPMEFPLEDPGAYTLLTGLSPQEIQERLEKHLGTYKLQAVTTFFGSRFTACPQDLEPVIKILHKKGVPLIDLNASPRSQILKLCALYHMPCARSVHPLDHLETPQGLMDALKSLETEALVQGHALGFAKATPYVIDGLAKWSKTLDNKGVDLVPLSIHLLKVSAYGS